MYKKNESETSHPDGCEKQLDYILVNRRYRWFSKDAEANDMTHMGSDHRCVMAHFVFLTQNKTYSHPQMNGSDKKKGVMDKTKQAMHDTKQEESSWIVKQYRLLQKEKKERTCKKKQACEEVGQSAAPSESAAARGLGTTRPTVVLDGALVRCAAVNGASMASQQPQQQQKQQMQRQDQSNTGSNPRQARGQSEGSGCSRSGSNEAAFDNSAVVHEKDADDGNNNEILTLMNERRSMNKEDKERSRQVSKKIKKCIRDQKNHEGNKKSWKHLKSSKESKNRERQICKGKNPHSEEKYER